MDDSSASTFDFDEWKTLAERDPDAFEARRASIIRQYIEQLPADRRRRLEGLQWRIDVERRKYKHPLVSSRWLYDLMWDSCAGKDGLLAAIRRLTGTGKDSARAIPARILPFRKAAMPD